MIAPTRSHRRAATASPALLILATSLALASGATRADTSFPEPTSPPDCVLDGASDANGDGLDDALVSPRAELIDAEVNCGARIGPGTRVIGGSVVTGQDSLTLIDPVVGARSFVGAGARVEGATIGNAVVVLGGARVIDADAEPGNDTVVGNRSFIGRDVLVTPGPAGTDIGRAAVILRGTEIRGGTYGPRLRVGPDVELTAVRVERNVTIGGGTRVGPFAFIESGVRVGSGVSIGGDSSIRPRSSIGNGTVIDFDVEIGPRAVVGENVTIGSSATIGRGANVGDGATIESGASVPEHAVVAPGETVVAD